MSSRADRTNSRPVDVHMQVNRKRIRTLARCCADSMSDVFWDALNFPDDGIVTISLDERKRKTPSPLQGEGGRNEAQAG